ncbi:MAG: ABC transporter substrate-binding protein [Bacilli bacterium]|nr:ABC transporter substrate-binding protein [Bacilli bacterium]
MKRKIIIYVVCMILVFAAACSVLFYRHDQNKNLTKISLAEVAHTVFYAPMYVAIENHYFEENGLDLDVILANGADKVAAALLSNDVQIGLSGVEATIYVYNGGEKNYLKTFSQLTQKDGSFIVSREKTNHFSLEDLKGKTVIGGRAAGMPEMTLEYVLRHHGIDPKEDLDIDTSIAFAAMGGTFIGGYGDYVTLFEPTASMVEKEGYGTVVASVGALGGVVPYTSFSARCDYIQKNPEIIKQFDRAIQMGLDYVHTHSDEDVAKTILPQFPDSSLTEITDAVRRYRSIEAWPKTTTFTQKSFDHMQDIMMEYGELNQKVPYQKLFYSIKKD